MAYSEFWAIMHVCSYDIIQNLIIFKIRDSMASKPADGLSSAHLHLSLLNLPRRWRSPNWPLVIGFVPSSARVQYCNTCNRPNGLSQRRSCL